MEDSVWVNYSPFLSPFLSLSLSRDGEKPRHFETLKPSARASCTFMHLYGIPETSRHQVQALDFRVNIWTRILQTGSRGARWTHKLLMVLSINHPPSGLGHHFEHNPPVILVVFWGLLHPTKKLKKWLLFMCFSMNNIDETNWPTMGPDSKQKTPDFFCYQKNSAVWEWGTHSKHDAYSSCSHLTFR